MVMDPLSVTASIIAVLGAVNVAIKGLNRINTLKDAPALIKQLASEVSEISLLMHVAKTATSSEKFPHDPLVTSGLAAIIERAGLQLSAITDMLRFQLLKDCRSLDDESKQIEVKWNIWLLKEGKIRRMIEGLAATKWNIASALTAITTIFTMDIPSIQVSLQQAEAANQALKASMIQLESSMVKNMRELSANATHLTGEKVMAPATCTSANNIKALSTHKVPTAARSSAIHQTRPPLSRLCSCNCHARVAVRSPQWLGSAFGSLLVNYSRQSSDSCRSCSRRSCNTSNESSFQSRYYFPSWMLHRMLAVQCKWNPLSGCNFALKTPRAISSRSAVFTLAQHGNIRGMQRLFEQRTASPYDISIEEGRSALHFAVTAQQPDMVAFLVQNGADPQLEDHNTLSAQDVIWNYLLQMYNSCEMEKLLLAAGLSLSDTESLEKRNFTTLHRIVLGLSAVDLESYLETSTFDLDMRDSLGKTPLCWAASRSNVKVVETLLRYGASPSIGDHRSQTPLHYCAGSGASESMDIILRAALEEARLRARKWKRQSGAESSEPSPDFLSTIVDARDSKGRTPLKFATRMNFRVHTELLISSGAKLEAIDSVLDRTMLLSAIYWKSHDVLPVLLTGGARTDVLDARGASLLHYAARYGDLAILRILLESRIGSLDINATDDVGEIPRAIFESRHERCVDEDDTIRALSLETFRKFLDRAESPYIGIDSESGESGIAGSGKNAAQVVSQALTVAQTWSLERRSHTF